MGRPELDQVRQTQALQDTILEKLIHFSLGGLCSINQACKSIIGQMLKWCIQIVGWSFFRKWILPQGDPCTWLCLRVGQLNTIFLLCLALKLPNFPVRPLTIRSHIREIVIGEIMTRYYDPCYLVEVYLILQHCIEELMHVLHGLYILVWVLVLGVGGYYVGQPTLARSRPLWTIESFFWMLFR